MNDDEINGWVLLFKTDDFMLAELTEAKLKDEEIEYRILNKTDIEQTLYVGNVGLGQPIKIYCKEEDRARASEIISEDNSDIFKDNPDIQT